DNQKNLETVRYLMQEAPGSTVHLIGHTDPTFKDSYVKAGKLHETELLAMELSQNRSKEIQRMLVEKLKIDPSRIRASGRGWEEPISKIPEENRRVEV